MDKLKVSAVAPRRQCNHATFIPKTATSDATNMQPAGIKDLALMILQRNRQCNQHATKAKKPCNFLVEKALEKFPPKTPDFTDTPLRKCDQPASSVTCFSCKGYDFWLSIHGTKVCRMCHPPAAHYLEVSP